MAITATITSVIPLSADARKTLLTALEKKYGKIQSIEKIDEKLIGGIKVTVGSEQYDSSIAGKISQLKKNLK